MSVLNFTPDNFIEVFLLSLFWEHGEPVVYRSRNGSEYHRDSWSTVDHVVTTLKNIGFLNDQQIKMLRDAKKGHLHQRKLRYYSAVFYGSELAENNCSLVYYQQGKNRGKAIPLPKLVRDVRISLTSRGKERAQAVEQKFLDLGLTKEIYLADIERVQALFKTDTAHGIANKRYRMNVNRELEEQEQRK